MNGHEDAPDAGRAAGGRDATGARGKGGVELTPVDAGAKPDLNPSLPDAQSASPDAIAPAGATGPFACTLVLGIKQTGEWFNAGFESVVDNARWEVVPVHNGHLELWADPKNGIWSQKPASPCAQNAGNPDRVLFVGTNYDYATTAEFVPKLTAVVETIEARFAAAKRIELLTQVRAPGNVACPGNLGYKTHIKPAQDESIALVAAKYPGLVFEGPKFEVRACSDYGLYPHFTGAPAMAIARRIAEHYRGSE